MRIEPNIKETHMKEINVNGCEIIGRGGQGTIYRLDEETIVKLYNPG